MANSGVFTDVYREKYADLAGNLVANPLLMPLVFFSVGEGGYQVVLGSKVPKTPDPTRTDLEATIDSRLLVGTSPTGAIFVKALAAGSVSVAGSTVSVTCELSGAEPDLDLHSHLTGNLLGEPEILELGIYDGDPAGVDPWVDKGDLMVYATLDEIVKTGGSSVTITVTIEQ